METLTVNICFASVVLPNKPTASPRPSDLGSWDVRNKEFTDKLSADEFLRGELDGRSCAVFDYIEWARNAWISSWFVKNQDLGSNPAEVSSFKVMSSKEVQSGVWSCAKLCVFFPFKVLWPLSASVEQLEGYVDTATFSLSILKKLCQASEATCSQWVTWRQLLFFFHLGLGQRGTEHILASGPSQWYTQGF